MTALQTTGRGSVGHLALDGIEVDDGRKVGGAEVVTWLGTLGTLGRSAFQLASTSGEGEQWIELVGRLARPRAGRDSL